MKTLVPQARAFFTSLAFFVFANAAFASTAIWIGNPGTSATTNWSDTLNWISAVNPNLNSVVFNNTGAVATAGTLTTVVDQNENPTTMVLTNGPGQFHTVLIPAGITLSVSSNFIVGGQSLDNFTTSVAMTGGGTLSASGTNFTVANSGASGTASSATLDLSALSNFVYTSSSGILAIGANGVRSIGTLAFAGMSNNITASAIVFETSASSSSVTGNSYLGAGTNIFNANNINLGAQRSSCNLRFTNATGGLKVRGTAGTDSSRATMVLGNRTAGGTSGTSTGTIVATNGHPVDMKLATLTIGSETANGAPIGASGTLNFDAGVVDATNVLMGICSGNSGASSTGNLIVGANGLLLVGGISLVNNVSNSPTCTGNLTINGGTVTCSNSIIKTTATGTGSITNIGGSLTVRTNIGTTAIPIDNLSLDNATLGLNVVGGASTPVINVVNLTAADVNTLNISVANVNGLATIPLIGYTGADPGTNSFVVNVPASYVGTLNDNGTGLISLDLAPAGVTIYPLLWVGAVGSTLNGNWNLTAANWADLTNGAPLTYNDPDFVTFDDSASNSTVHLTASFLPGSLTFSNGIAANPLTGNPLAYTLTGPGSIGGTIALVNANSGSVTLQETGGDNFSGGITIGNGGTVVLDNANSSISGGATIGGSATLQIGKNDANGNFPGPVVDNGTLIFSRANSLLVSSDITGSGSLVQAGAGTLTLTASNEFNGTTTVTNGTLALTGAGSLAANFMVNVDSNATLDVSGVTGGPAFQNVTLGNCTLTQALTNQQPITVSGGLFINPSSTITINVTSLPAIAAYPTVLTNVAASGGLVNYGGTVQAGTLPAGYAGHVDVVGNAILLTLTSGPTGVRPYVIWSGADSANSTNWSDAQDWQLAGAPTSVDNVIFNNTAAAFSSALSSPGGGSAALTGTFNNAVDTSFTVNTLTFTNLGSTYHNTVIANGATLSVANTLTVGGISTDGNTSDQGFVTVSGAGTLSVVNTTNNLQVWYGNPSSGNHQATLDLSALANFTASVSRLAIGASVSNTVDRASGIVYLAKTNNVTAVFATTSTDSTSTPATGSIVVADSGSNAGSQSQLWLGEVNNITADTIGIGRQKASATLKFNPIYANVAPYPSVVFEGLNGNPVTMFEVGNGVGNSGTTTLTADTDLTGGFVTANIGTLNVARSSANTNGTGITTGTLEFDAGTITAATVNIGFQTASNINKYGVGTITVNTNATIGANATLSVSGSLNLGLTIAAGSATSGTLNIGGGTVLANAITAGTNSTSTVTLNANGNSGVLAVTNGIGSLVAPLGTLNLQGGTLQLSLNASITNVVANSVSISGPTTLNIASITTTIQGAQEIPVINYVNGADPGLANLTIGTIPAGYSAASLVDNGTGLISLQITPPPALTWAGATSGGTLDGNWNTSDQNWKSGASFVAYANPDFATFNDAASNFVVNLTTTLTPSSLTINNSLSNYVFNGSGKLSGTLALNKSGTGSLTLNETGGDNFTAGIAVNGGAVILNNANSAISGPVTIAANSMLQVGNNNANGNLPAGSVTDNGALVFDQSVSNTAANVISGSGSVTNNGSGTVTLTAANTFAGGVTVNNGTVRVNGVGGGNSALGPGVTTVNAGGTLIGGSSDSFGFMPNHNNPTNIYINGGTVTDSGTANYRVTLPNLQFNGGTLTSAPTNTGDTSGNFSLFGYANPGVATNSTVTTVPSSSTATISAAAISFQTPATFNVAAGTTPSGIDLLITSQLLPFTNTTMAVTKTGAGVLALDASSPIARFPLTINQGTVQLGASGDTTNLNSPMGTNTVSNGGTLVFASSQSVTAPNAISGTGNVVVNSGTAVLSGASSYSGTTAVNGGVLSVSGSLSGSAITVAGAGTLTGAGSINTATVNGTIAPGSSASTGTLTASAGVTLNGNTVMKLNTSTNDVLAVGGTLNYGGTLTLTNISATPLAVGNSFQLFSSGAYNGTFSSIVTQPPLAAGLSWNNSAPGVFTIVGTASPSTNASITHVSLSGTNLLVHGTNNNVPNTNFHYAVLISTNLKTPLSNWTIVGTNSFNVDGTFDCTNPIVPGTPRQFIDVEAVP